MNTDVLLKQELNAYYEGEYTDSSTARLRLSGVIGEAFKLGIEEQKQCSENLKVVGYQARVLPNGGWRFIQPTKTESILERMAYLKSIMSNGKPVYQVRTIYSEAE